MVHLETPLLVSYSIGNANMTPARTKKAAVLNRFTFLILWGFLFLMALSLGCSDDRSRYLKKDGGMSFDSGSYDGGSVLAARSDSWGGSGGSGGDGDSWGETGGSGDGSSGSSGSGGTGSDGSADGSGDTVNTLKSTRVWGESCAPECNIRWIRAVGDHIVFGTAREGESRDQYGLYSYTHPGPAIQVDTNDGSNSEIYHMAGATSVSDSYILFSDHDANKKIVIKLFDGTNVTTIADSSDHNISSREVAVSEKIAVWRKDINRSTSDPNRYVQIYDIASSTVLTDVVMDDGEGLSGYPMHVADDRVFLNNQYGTGAPEGIYIWQNSDPPVFISSDTTFYATGGPEHNVAYMVMRDPMGPDEHFDFFYVKAEENTPTLIGTSEERAGVEIWDTVKVHGSRVAYATQERAGTETLQLWDNGSTTEVWQTETDIDCHGLNATQVLWTTENWEGATTNLRVYDGSSTKEYTVDSSIGGVCDYGGGQHFVWENSDGLYIVEVPE